MVAAVSAAFVIGTAAYADGANVTVNGIALDTQAELVNDRTLVPLRAVANALGCGVAWDEDDQGILLYRTGNGIDVDESLILCWIGKDHAFRLEGFANTGSAVMDVPPQIINDRTYVPIRAIAELLGAEVSWDSATSTAIINGTVTEGATDEFAQQLSEYEIAMYDYYDVYKDYADGTGNTVQARILLESGGEIDLELYYDIAPITVSNFVKLAESGYYDGLTFHRVIEDFMIQGGGYDADGNASETQNIPGEFAYNGYPNFIPHSRGTISMARAQIYNSASGQFFITQRDCPSLDGSYASFGKVTSGIEYVDEIAQTETDANNKPINNIIIKHIEVVTNE
jgi:peptidyl-prolyl cis-trans isomerase B (cyclophilin B)